MKISIYGYLPKFRHINFGPNRYRSKFDLGPYPARGTVSSFIDSNDKLDTNYLKSKDKCNHKCTYASYMKVAVQSSVYTTVDLYTLRKVFFPKLEAYKFLCNFFLVISVACSLRLQNAPSVLLI